MTSIYDSLEAKIYAIAGGDKKTIKFYKELAHLYFTESKEFDDLPDSLKLALAEWENEQQELDSLLDKHREAPIKEDI